MILNEIPPFVMFQRQKSEPLISIKITQLTIFLDVLFVLVIVVMVELVR